MASGIILVVFNNIEKIIEYLRQTGFIKQHIFCQSYNINMNQIIESSKND